MVYFGFVDVLFNFGSTAKRLVRQRFPRNEVKENER